MACNTLARKTMAYVFYSASIKNVTKNLLQRSALFLSPSTTSTSSAPPTTLLHSDSSSSSSRLPWSNEFPLPGNVAVDLEELSKVEGTKRGGEMMLEMDDDAKRAEAVFQFLESMATEAAEQANSITPAQTDESCIHLNTESPHNVECRIDSCPPSLKRGFQRLFEKTDRRETLTVLTISQHTENDMTTWSDTVEEEREALTRTFIQNAMEIVGRVEEHGYWADFIDPCSGQPFNGNYKNETLFETDDRFNQLGFRIEDLGCCKAIAHKRWGTNVFVGVLFTSAPASMFSDVSGGNVTTECS